MSKFNRQNPSAHQSTVAAPAAPAAPQDKAPEVAAPAAPEIVSVDVAAVAPETAVETEAQALPKFSSKYDLRDPTQNKPKGLWFRAGAETEGEETKWVKSQIKAGFMKKV